MWGVSWQSVMRSFNSFVIKKERVLKQTAEELEIVSVIASSSSYLGNGPPPVRHQAIT